MSGVAKAVQHRRNMPDHHVDRAGRTALAIAGALFSLVGLILAIGGYLSPTNGSAFQMLTGLGLIVSGTLVARRHRAGAWAYMLVFAGTVSWSLRNIEAGSSLAGRLVGPTLLLVMMAVLMPLLCGWRARRTLTVFILLIAGTIGLGISSLPNGPLEHRTAAVTQFLDAETKGALQ
jgi:quinoprotein glucose dehydrogenase